MRRPFENKQLVGTKNALRLNNANFHYAVFPETPTFNLGSSDFTISICVLYNVSAYQTALQFANNSYYGFYIGQGYGSPAACFSIKSAFGENYAVALDGFTLNTGEWNRFTIIRRGNNIETWINNRRVSNVAMLYIGGGETFNLGNITRFNIGGEDNGFAGLINGAVSNFFILSGSSLTQNEMDELHNTNVIPNSKHIYVSMHLPMNQSEGSIVRDVLPLYRYCKSKPYKVNGYDAGIPWEFFVNGAAPTITYGTDGDGDYVQFENDVSGDSCYFYPTADMESRVLGTYYKLTFKIKRVAGGGIFNIQQYGSTTDQVYYNLSETPLNELRTITIDYLANYNYSKPIILLSGVSSGAEIGDTYRVYLVENTPIIQANHGDLINFSNDEIGATNLLIQSAWNNLYEERKVGDYYLKPVNDVYGIPSGYASQTFTDWTMLIDFVAPISTPSLRVLFGNQVTDDIDNIALIFLDGGTMTLYLGEVNPGTISYTPGERYKLILEGNSVAGTTKYTLISRTGSNTGTRNFVPHDFEIFSMGKHPQGTAYFNGAYGRYSLFNRILSGSELEILKDPNALSRRLALSGLQFDIDFGNVFEDSGDYFATDYSGNDRHAELFNFDATDDQPQLIEQSTGLPPIRKALQLAGSGEYIYTGGFVPTSEEGYTYIFGFIKTTENFSALDYLLYKECGTSNKRVSATASTKMINFSALGTISYDLLVDFKKLDGVQYFAIHEKAFNKAVFVNGFRVSHDTTSGAIPGFDGGAGNTFIFSQPGGSFEGYAVHLSIYKGLLSQAKILDVINHGSGSNEGIPSNCELYLNFNEVANIGGDGKIPDHSVNNRNVYVSGLTSNEMNPAHADYRVVDINSLNHDGLISDPALPSSILAKAWAWYKTDTKNDFETSDRGDVAVWTDQLGDSSRDLHGAVSGGRIISSMRQRRVLDTNMFTFNSVVQEEGNRLNNLSMATKNMNFLHDGSDWFVAFIYGRQSGMVSYFWNPIVQTGALGGGGGGYTGMTIQMLADPAGKLFVNLENGVGRAVTFASDATITEDELHLVIVTFNGAAGSNNLSVYLDGSTTPLTGSSRTSNGVYDSGDSSNIPEFFKFQANNDPEVSRHGEMIIGDQLLDLTEIQDLIDYFEGKYGTFPKPM